MLGKSPSPLSLLRLSWLGNQLSSVFGVTRPPDLMTKCKAGKVLIYSRSEPAIFNTFVFTARLSAAAAALCLVRAGGRRRGPGRGTSRRLPAAPPRPRPERAPGTPPRVRSVRCERGRVQGGPFGCPNRRRNGCCEWHVVNENSRG